MDFGEVKKYPDQVLRSQCQPIQGMTEREKKIFFQMLAIMRRFGGIGLAAPQIGLEQRLIVADIGQGAVTLANPRIMTRKGKSILADRGVECKGCLEKEEFIKMVQDTEHLVNVEF